MMQHTEFASSQLPSTEQAIQFSSHKQQLSGIFTPGQQQTGLLVVVGGPQYRVGSHRQFVKLCRAVGAAGFASLRFDVAGMGDSTGEASPFYLQQADMQAAIDQLFLLQPQLKSVLLWGLCDGASAILLSQRQQPDPRVRAVVLLNPWVRQQHSYAQTLVKHYYLQRFSQKEFWQKLFSGKFQLTKSVQSLWQNLRQARQQTKASPAPEHSNEQNYVAHMQQGWQQFEQRSGQVTVITSGNDLTAQEFLDLTKADSQWQQLLQQADHQHLPAANHTFSTALWRQQVEQITIACLQRLG